MKGVTHFMENGNFLCGFIGGGIVYEADTEDEVTCPECRKIIDARNKKKKRSLYNDDED